MGDDIPLARLSAPIGYASDEVAQSDFAYYATLCADFSGETSSDAARLPHGRAGGRSACAGRSGPSTSRGCRAVDWPGRTVGRPSPAPLTTTPFPVIVAERRRGSDHAAETASRIAARLSDGYLLTTAGGGHGSFGLGAPCPDAIVAALLLRDERPKTRMVDCPGRLTARYIPPLPVFKGLAPIDIARAIDDELWSDPDLLYPAPNDPQGVIGCRHGGTIGVNEESDSLRLTFHDCQIFSGQPMSGTARYANEGGATFDIRLPDGPLEYAFDEAGRETINGRDAGGLPPRS